MLIPGKSTLDRSWIAGGVLAGRSPMLFPDDAGTPSIDWDSGRRHAQNVAKWPRERATGGAQPEKHNGWSAPGRRAGESPPAQSDAAGQLVKVAGGWAHETAGSGWVSGAVVNVSKHRLGKRWRDAIADWMSGTGNAQACCWTRPDDRLTSQWSFLFPIEADWSGRTCTAGPIQWCN